ncbi:MAG TPA: Nramp family divalent metal transporter [Aeriscardovia aeriphila]|uniref:Nramp family divalent metal transporter n=1 Tax=Aeriscardovia aeriphila TaxID=218139 RepID=A0A921KAR4_9BIFI|nr:Nramp family divalent metal transporter [Aeriscardovia aeriphila]
MRTLRRVLHKLSFLGPSFVAAVAYLDPGNFATNFSAGSTYGYMLVWVVVVANLMAMLIQYLAARIGILTGKTLAELIAERTSRPMRLLYWLQAQIVTIATDMAEVVGGAVALYILFRMPIVIGALVTVAISTLILLLQNRSWQQLFEWAIIAMVLAITGLIFWDLAASHPQVLPLLAGLQPKFDGKESLVLAAGILGATVMPHAIYAHSALVRDRFGVIGEHKHNAMLKATALDIVLSMLIAGAVNGAMVVIAAAAFHGMPGGDTLEGAHHLISSVLGAGPALAFALALFIAGLASTTVGSYSGSVVMNGLLTVEVTPLVSRLVTAIPAVMILALGVDPTRTLVISQVVLSFGIPFVLIPLLTLTARRSVLARPLPKLVYWLAVVCAALIVALNVALLISLL